MEDPGSEDYFFGNVIHTYTRKQAIEDGVLIDVSKLAKEAGIVYPVAMTDTVYQKYVTVPEGAEAQDETGRLWDIVYLLRLAIQKSKGESQIEYKIYVKDGSNKLQKVILKALFCPGDDAEPVITI